MALNKAVPTEFGDAITATYWNIGEVHDNIKDRQLRLVFYGYADDAARRAGKIPMASTVIELLGPNYPDNATRAQMYAEAKKQARFSGASDV